MNKPKKRKICNETLNIDHGYNEAIYDYKKFLPSEKELKEILRNTLLDRLAEKGTFITATILACIKAQAKAISKRIGK